MTYVRGLLAGLTLGFAWLAAPAEAVTVTVTDAGGNPVAGASVSLGGVTGQTDKDGKATLDRVPTGSQALTVESDDIVTTRRTVNVGTGDAPIGVSVDRRYGWMTQTPPWGSLGVGPIYEGNWHSDLDIKKSVLRDTQGGVLLGEIRPDLGDLNRDFKYRLNLNEAGVDVPFGFPGFNLGDCVHVSPAVSLFMGGNTVSIKQDGPGSGNDTKLSGSGFTWGVGAELGFSVRPHGEHQWLEDLYARVGYKYRQGWADVSRSPGESENLGFGAPPATSTISEDGDLDWRAHTVYGHVGYSFLNDRLFPYAGVQWQRRSFDLDTHSVVDVPGPGRVTRDISQEFRSNEVQGVVGLDARPFGTYSRALSPLFLRAELNFNGQSLGTQVKLIYQFNLFDRW